MSTTETTDPAPATLAYIYAANALADVTLSPELLEAAKAAYEAAHDAWLASDEHRDWQVGGETWGHSWGDVAMMIRPSDIEAEIQDCCRNGSWETEKTMWVSDYACPIDPVTDEPLYGERVNVTTTIEPEEPDCTGSDHDWQSPHNVVGGCEENAGVHGHGGGVIITEVCAHCGRYRITDSWATNPETGEQGLTSIEYEEADEQSTIWLRTIRDNEMIEACPYAIKERGNGCGGYHFSIDVGAADDDSPLDAIRTAIGKNWLVEWTSECEIPANGPMTRDLKIEYNEA